MWLPHSPFVYSRVNKNGEKPQIKVMRKFEEFKESVIESFVEMDENNDDPDFTFFKDVIKELEQCFMFSCLATELVKVGYWEVEDAIHYGRSVEEE